MARIEKSVFISYRRKDLPWALLVYKTLSANGFDVFFDFTSIPGGKFEPVILSNIKARAHFLVILTPQALQRCNEPGDWLRREIETAIDEERNIIPLFFGGFDFGDPTISAQLSGKLETLKAYNGLEVPDRFFDAAMGTLRTQFLDKALDIALQPISSEAQEEVEAQQEAANKAISKKEARKRLWVITAFGILSLFIVAVFACLANISTILSALVDTGFIHPRQAPQAKSLHYLFIVDSSDRMAQAFPGSPSKWNATRQSVLDHLVLGLPPRANYSLIVLGGKSLPHTGSCKQRESNLLVPMGADNRDEVIAGFETLEPGGAAPLEDALEKARQVLFDLPADEERALFLFLGGGDDCAEDQWKSLKYFLKDSAQYIDARIEIVLLPGEDVDETVRAVSEVQELIAENALDNVGVHLPKDAPALDRTNVQIQDQALEDAQRSEPTAVSFQRTALVEASATAVVEQRSNPAPNPPIPPNQPVSKTPTAEKPYSPGVTKTFTQTASLTTPPTRTPTYTRTPTATFTPTQVPTNTRTATVTPAWTDTPTPTFTPTLPPVVWAALPSQPDVFSTACPLTGQARVYARFYRLPAGISAALVSNGRTNQGVRLDFTNVREEEGNYAGWEIWLGADDESGIDLNSYNSLVFYIRGEVGGEEPNLYLMNPSTGENYKRYWKDVEQVTPITTSWQPVVIPLSYFTSGPVPGQQVDLSDIQRIQVLFEWYPQSTSGRIYIDDLCVQ